MLGPRVFMIRLSYFYRGWSYLSGRSYRVKIGNSLSQRINVTEGTAQGSVLGPLHYLSYVNDMNNCVEFCSVYQYADDTCLLIADRDLKTAEQKLQHDFNRICRWSHDAGLVLNAEKTKLLHVRSAQSRTVGEVTITGHGHDCLHLMPFSASCNCPPLQQVNEIRYLGLLLDSNFNWKPHVDLVCDKLRAFLAKLYVLRSRVPFNVRVSMYTGLAQSIILYGLSSYGRTFKTYLDQIYNIQVRILKLVVPFDVKSKVTDDLELFQFCKVLPVQILFKIQILKEQYFRTELQRPISHSTVTRQITNKLLNVPKSHNVYGKRTSEYIVPSLINTIPLETRQKITRTNISSVLKKEMPMLLYNKIGRNNYHPV
ncbi:reverse transcriptase (RNA-dependent DNA polymerase) domain-containing protein [Phthorimaea operculella]|nr:reverse transcriptase (RNA-dependent DNA polymerase) domain-containing protein [Phthorimaea operculella]